MVDKLIVAVSSRTELYDTRSFQYRNRSLKEQAWTCISREVGMPEDQCRKRWKSLRDIYVREKRKEADRRSNADSCPLKRWKYSAVLSFLDPYFQQREARGNTDTSAVEEQGAAAAAEYNPQSGEEVSKEAGEKPAASAQEAAESGDGIELVYPPLEPEFPLLGPPAAAASSPAAGPSSATSPFPADSPSSAPCSLSAPGPTAPGASSAPARVVRRRRRRKQTREEPFDLDAEILKALRAGAQTPTEPPVLTPTQQFFGSLVPMVDALSPQKREEVKFQMYQLVFEAASLEPCVNGSQQRSSH